MNQAGIAIDSFATALSFQGSDAECLAAYQCSRSEPAFSAIVERHGAMVFRTCHRLLSNIQEAEDAAQAVFIVLASQSHAARLPLAIWLHDRARDSARVVLRSRLRRQRREIKAAQAAQAAQATGQHAMNRSESHADLREELDAAIARLPATLREALVLRYLEGHRLENSARIAGCSERTFARYCSEGLERLRAILSRSGSITTSAALIALLTQEAAAKVSSSTLIALKATFAAKSAVAGSTAHGLANTMFWAKAKLAGIALTVAATVVAAPTVMNAFSSPPRPQAVANVVSQPPAAPPAVVISEEERNFLKLQQTIKPTAAESAWERIPWLTSLWEARRASVAQQKPICFFDAWGHPLGATSSEGLQARARVFSDPDVLKTITDKFVPCVSDDWYESKRQDDEGRFFWLFARKRQSVSSLIYCIAPDGSLLAPIAEEADAVDARTQLAEALDAYGHLAAVSRTVNIPTSPQVDATLQRSLPPHARVVRVFGRALARNAGALLPATVGIAPEFTAPGRDNMWLREDEWRALIVKNVHPGDFFDLPAPILQRLCRFHLVDNTRGEGVNWEDDGVIAASVTLTVTEVNGSKVKLRASGSALLATNPDVRRANCGFEPKLEGYVEYDTKTEQLERFDLAATGEHWGEGEYNPGARPGRQPFGVAFELAPDNPKHPRPADAAPPHAIRGLDYFDGPQNR